MSVAMVTVHKTLLVPSVLIKVCLCRTWSCAASLTSLVQLSKNGPFKPNLQRIYGGWHGYSSPWLHRLRMINLAV